MAVIALQSLYLIPSVDTSTVSYRPMTIIYQSQGTGTADEMAIDERKVLAEDGTVFAAVDVSRGLLPGATVSPDEVSPQGLGSVNIQCEVA